MIKNNAVAVAALIWGSLLWGSLPATPADAALLPNASVASAKDEAEGYRDYIMGRYAWSNDELAAAAHYFSRALRSQQDDPVLRQRTFELALASGDRRLALDIAKDVLRSDPQNSTAALVLIADKFRTRDYAEAQKLTSTLAVGGIEAVVSPILGAWAAYGQGRKQEALDAVQPSGADGVVKLYRLEHAGHIALAMGRASEALDFFRQALEMDGNSRWRLRLAAAAAAQRMGDAEQAAALLAMETDPDRQAFFAEARERLANGKKIAPLVSTPVEGMAELMLHAANDLMQGEPIPLALVFSRVAEVARPDMVEARLLSARMLRLSKEYRGALATVEGLAPQGPFGVDIMLEQARNLQELSRGEEAIGLLESASVRYPHSRRVRIELGEAFRRMERYEEAVDAFSSAIALIEQPGQRDWFLYFLRGVGYEKLGRMAETEADLRRALALNPDEPNVLNYLGYLYLDQRRNLNEAKQLISRAVELRPDDGFIIDSLGWAYFMSGQYEEAVRHLEQAVAVEPGDPTINEHLGDAYWRVGRTIEARFRWKAAMDSEPEAGQSRRLMSKLDVGLDIASAAATPAKSAKSAK
ncbi:MAG TPA: tetratricopeptide repeat protein [Pedomonas sp.]|uniref:tetratricopeptide repeat protein n=1 Tax=Pedomonas sp. TaxID=2976421 RepID=UPI002F3ECB10